MDAMENFMVKDFTEHSPEEERENRRDKIRAEILRYNEDTEIGSQDDHQPFIPDSYIEPTSDGYPGLDAPLG